MRPNGTKKTGNKFLESPQLETFIKTVKKNRKLRDEVLFRLTLFLGLRVQEICNIEVGHIDLKDRTITVQGIKNGRKRIYVFDQEVDLWRKVSRLTKQQMKEETVYLFPSPKGKAEQISTTAIKGLFKRYAKRAGLSSHFSIHSLRHTIGVMMAEKKFTAIQIMHCLRHRNVTSTQVYFEGVNFKEDDKRMSRDFGTFL